MLKRWAVDNFDRIKTDYEANRKNRTLALGSSRKNNNWYPMLTIADAVGGQWPERVRYSIEAMQKTEHALSMYLADLVTVSDNLDGIPASSLPCGTSDGMPVGLQLHGPALDEATPLRVANVFQRNSDHHESRPPEIE